MNPAVFGLLGPLLFIGAFLVLGAVRPNYSPIRVFVSQLSLNGGGGWQVANFIASGVLVLVFGWALRDVVKPGILSPWTWPAVTVVGVGLILLGFFRDDGWFGYPPGSPPAIGMPRSWHGWGHLSTACVTAVGIVLGPLGVLVASGSSDATWIAYCLVTPVAFLGLYGLGLASSQGWVLPDRAGLFQRAALITGLAWIAVLALRLL
jgi:hypothetical protein